MRRAAPLLVGFSLLAAASSLQASRPLQVDDLFKVKRVGDPQISSQADLAYQVGTVDFAANKTVNRIWLKATTGEAKELDLGSGSQSRPRFSPDGKRLAYQSGGQIWIVDLSTKEKRQLTKLSGSAEGQLWSPDGKWIAFLSTTVPSGNDAENAAYLKAKEASKVSGRLYTTLTYRHWNEWKDARQVSHLFVVPADGSAAPRDLTAGFTTDVPNYAGVSAGDGYAWAPDSQALAFESAPDQPKATSTNGEIYEVALSGGPARKLTTNPAMDNSPRYSPDGKSLAWRAQRREGFEADKWELWVMDRSTGKVVRTTAAFDQSFGDFAWQGSDLVAVSEKQGQAELFRWDGKGLKQLSTGLHIEGFALSQNAATVVSSSLNTPPDLYTVDFKTGQATRASRHNEALAQELGLNAGEPLWVDTLPVDGKPTKTHAYIVKPLGFDPKKTYPVAFVIHGGPQGAWANAWHPRWNAQAWASRGFITVLPNPRGSTGFGQAYCDAISGDWNGAVMTDLMNTLDASLKAVPNADPKRVVAAGGSYGGYAVNWISGHYADRFAAFVTHASIFNTESMQLGTEELWFPHWEFKGWPWESAANKARWQSQSPTTGIANMTKPMLVIHGELDYRVPVTEAFQLYNTLQVRGIPSQLLYFPDEAHFVAKPQNSKLWYETVLGWCEKWTK
ncbi:S9 family peptidase [Geothrix sp. PMB-07]|uniref:alpha/beta hydrolase family protein n=1 Tax=Geothrix sp. PMB-07 TaxID=3068640 RepID=UPI00274191B9|nr:S9 family peptidase [Geothrix sp. PMB-07]WLT31851.1 S9 family peptidase [Geothrix sp. PMB-07]